MGRGGGGSERVAAPPWERECEREDTAVRGCCEAARRASEEGGGGAQGGGGGGGGGVQYFDFSQLRETTSTCRYLNVGV